MTKAKTPQSHNDADPAHELDPYVRDERVEAIEKLWNEMEDLLDETEESLEKIQKKAGDLLVAAKAKGQTARDMAKLKAHLGKMEIEELQQRLSEAKDDLVGAKERIRTDVRFIKERFKAAFSTLTGPRT